MAASRPYWGPHSSTASVCVRLNASMASDPNNTQLHNTQLHNTQLQQQQQQQQQQQAANAFQTESPPCQTPLYAATHHHLAPFRRNNLLRPQEGDQVVPSFQRLTVLEGHHKRPKPLPPPPPDPEELMSDEAADSEVEFFTSDQRSLLPKSCGKAAPCFRAASRGALRGLGQVNYAYQGVPAAGEEGGGGGGGGGGAGWTRTEDGAGPTGWGAPGCGDAYGNRGQPLLQRGEGYEQMASRGRRSASSASRNPAPPPDRPLSSGLRYPCPGSATPPPPPPPPPPPQDRPVVPPRVPIHPPPGERRGETAPPATGGRRRTGPPGSPPGCPWWRRAPPPRTPSPKSLPIYINGVMPATQSFAPNPKYVRRAPAAPRQPRARAPPADRDPPCIVPVLKDGRQASATHYFLLPRPAYQERLQRILGQSERADGTTDSGDQKRS